jgi:hypothetical protein
VTIKRRNGGRSAAKRGGSKSTVQSPKVQKCLDCFHRGDRSALGEALIELLEGLWIQEWRKAFPEVFVRLEARRTEEGRKAFPTIFPPEMKAGVLPWPAGGRLAYTLSLARAGNVDAARQLLADAAQALRARAVLPEPLADHIADCLEREDLGTSGTPKQRRFKDWKGRYEVASLFAILKREFGNATRAAGVIAMATELYPNESSLRRACDSVRDEVLALPQYLLIGLALEAVYGKRPRLL